jgi:hypothetical protein
MCGASADATLLADAAAQVDQNLVTALARVSAGEVISDESLRSGRGTHQVPHPRTTFEPMQDRMVRDMHGRHAVQVTDRLSIGFDPRNRATPHNPRQ